MKLNYAEHHFVSHPRTKHNNLSVHKYTSQTSNSDYHKRLPYLLRLEKTSQTIQSSTVIQSFFWKKITTTASDKGIQEEDCNLSQFSTNRSNKHKLSIRETWKWKTTAQNTKTHLKGNKIVFLISFKSLCDHIAAYTFSGIRYIRTTL